MNVSTEQPTSETVFNVPNQLTTARLLLAIGVFVLLPLERYVSALVVFLIASGTDWIDGYWARKYGQVTQLGRILDPFVDKILICGTFIYLAAEAGSGVLPWMAVVVVGRELLVTALRGYMEQRGADFSAKMPGKLKMVFQCAAVVASLVALHYGAANLSSWSLWTLAVLVWLAILSTIYSGVDYIFAAVKLLRR